MNIDIQEAKRRLPLPRLMAEVGYGDRAKKSARCPFHDDQTPSFSVFEKDGQWFWKCHAGCGEGDEIDFIAKAKGIDIKEAANDFLRRAGVTRGSNARASAPKQSESEAKPAVQPRPLGELLDAVVGILRRYVVFAVPEQPEVIALWVAHTWVLDAAEFTAYLAVTAASKRSGKSRVLEVLKLLARNPKLTQSGSAAALVRSIKETNPVTILLDEIDRVYSGKSGDAEATQSLGQFLNAGFERGATFLRCVGQGSNQEPREFFAFCPKAVAGIALNQCLPDTVQDRSLLIELERQSREHRAERLRKRDAIATTGPIQLEAWAGQPSLINALQAARPDLPNELNDRQQDICESLIAIADLAGGKWPQKARAALVRLCVGVEDVDVGVKLLAAIKEIFDETVADKLTTRDILEHLAAIEDGPWAFMFEDVLKHDKLQTAASKLARKLKPYKTPDGEPIQPRVIKLADGSTPRGYHKEDFRAAWARYLPTPAPIPLEAATSATYEGESVAPSQSSCTKPQPNTQAATNLAREVAEVAAVAPLQATGHRVTGKAHSLLADLVTIIQAAKGLHPAGHPDCQWGEDYPFQYFTAIDSLEDDRNDKERMFYHLASLVHKVEHEFAVGTPLTTGTGAREWREGFYPEAFTAARAYVREQMELQAA